MALTGDTGIHTVADQGSGMNRGRCQEEISVKQVVAIGIQDFEALRTKNLFYIDKTDFIREWWNGEDAVTLITRPRRFGKTLNMSMLNCFFSNQYQHRGELFEGLRIWEDSEMPGDYSGVKVYSSRKGEAGLEDTAPNALRQITEKGYETDLLDRGIPPERILKYGIAFRGKECRILMA